MADQVTLNPGSGGAIIRTKDRGATGEVQIVGLDVGIGSGTELLMTAGQATMVNSIGVVIASDQTAIPVTGAMKDAGPAQATSFGVGGVIFASANQSGAAAAVTDAPTGGQKLVITDLEISVDTAMTLTFTCETTGAMVGKYFMQANSTLQLTLRGKRKLATADKRLMVQSSVAGNIAIGAGFYSEA